MPEETSNYTLPFVTVVMPVRNEANFIERSLGAILHQTYPHEHLEVLVVDGMSDDNTRKVVEAIIAANTHMSIRLLDNPGQIAPTALNIALEHAKGEVFVRVDGHCELAHDYIQHGVALLHEYPNVAGVGGPIETISETSIGETIAIAMSSPFGVGDSAFRTVKDQTRYVDTVPFPIYRRRALQEAGPFDENLVRNQDDEYNFRLRKIGYKILLSSHIRSRYYSRSSINKLAKQYYQYGFFKIPVMQKHPRQMSLRQFVPAAFVLVLAGGGVFAIVNKWLRRLWMIVVGAYILANGLSSFQLARHNGWAHLPRLPLTFAVLHISYGLGFLRGLVRFLRPRF